MSSPITNKNRKFGILAIIFCGFLAAGFFGFLGLASAASTPECMTSCGDTGSHPIIDHTQCCAGSSCFSGYLYNSGAYSDCVSSGSAWPNNFCQNVNSSIRSLCCANGFSCLYGVHTSYWVTGAICGGGNVCQCWQNSGGRCLPPAECKLAYTPCSDSSQCCSGMACNSGYCGGGGRCLNGYESCSCNSQCCSGTCTSGQCTTCTANGQTCVSSGDCCSNSCLLFLGVGYRCTPGSPPFPDNSFCTQANQCSGGYCCNNACKSTACPIENCSNNIDDDGDGLIDCKDFTDCPSGCANCQSATCNGTTYDWSSCSPIVSCISNDGCCPSGCIPSNDSDCSVVTGCSMANLNCPATCTIGQNFNISYDYRNTNYLVKPNISQRIADWNYNSLWCLADQTVSDNAWHSVVRSIPCTGTVNIGGHSNAGHWTDWCDYSWTNAQIGCSLTCNVTPVAAIPPAIGYVKVKHPLGILSLRLISFSDAFSFLKGIFKVSRFGGDTNASADLVETTDPNASPVRVKTPYGIKAWRKQ